MDYRRREIAHIDKLWEVQKLYKAEIEENLPSDQDRDRLQKAILEHQICFYGAWDSSVLVGCCSITIGFSIRLGSLLAFE